MTCPAPTARLLTGDVGRTRARYRDPDLLGHVCRLYVVGQPAHAFVLSDAAGIAGYCLAALDSRTFEAWAERDWWPNLRRHYPLPATDAGDPGAPDATDPAPLDAQAPDAVLIRIFHAPVIAPQAVVTAYPSQLHIDLLQRARGLGFGRRMVEVQLESLRRAGSPGVHLEVDVENANGIDFYDHLGFKAIERSPDSIVMGRRLSDA
jgi:GNAT superfamily N-acetyltransferase